MKRSGDQPFDVQSASPLPPLRLYNPYVIADAFGEDLQKIRDVERIILERIKTRIKTEKNLQKRLKPLNTELSQKTEEIEKTKAEIKLKVENSQASIALHLLEKYDRFVVEHAIIRKKIMDICPNTIPHSYDRAPSLNDRLAFLDKIKTGKIWR